MDQPLQPGECECCSQDFSHWTFEVTEIEPGAPCEESRRWQAVMDKVWLPIAEHGI